jgi:2,3-bisphosphoglycerate-dependent phosphoglycerate mutase
MAATLLLVRNGETDWNRRHIFLGWADVDLTETGFAQALRGGELARAAGVLPDFVHTSLLNRGIHTAERFLAGCNRSWIPVRRSWRLNERHYGALQGREESAMREQYGDEAVTRWRTSSTGSPPPISDDDPYAQVGDDRYRDLLDAVPRTEFIDAVGERTLAYFHDAVIADLRAGTVLISSHGNPLRTLVAHLEGRSNDALREFDIPAGVALRYDLDEVTFRPIGPAVFLDSAASQPVPAA